MIRKILLGILIVILVLIIGAYVLFKTKGDVLLQKFGEYVEENTGAPLNMERIPSLTFFPSPGLNVGKASWGRQDGEIYVSFSRASVRVSGRAMLSGKVEITSLELDDLEVTLRPNTTVKPQATPASASPAGQAASGDRGSLENHIPRTLQDRLHRLLTKAPETIVVKNGKVTIIQPDGKTVTLHQADLQLKDVKPGQDISLDFKGNVDASQPAIGGELEVKATLFLSDRRDEAYVRTKLDKAVFTRLRGLAFNDPVRLEGEFDYLLDSDRLGMSHVTVGGLGMQLQANGEIQNVSKITVMPLSAEVLGSMQLKAQGSPRTLLDALGKTVVTADPKALGLADFDLELALRQGDVYLNRLSGTLDDIKVEGDVRIGFSQPMLVGSLVVGDVKLQGYLPPKPVAQADQPGTTDQIPADGKPVDSAARTARNVAWPDVNLQLRMNSLETGDIRLEKLDVAVQGNAGSYHVAPFSMNALGGGFSGTLDAVFAGKTIPAKITAVITTNLNANSIDLAQLATLLRKPGLVSGQGRLQTALSFNTASPMTTVSGTGTVIAEPLHLGVSLLPDNATLPPGTPDIRDLDKAVLTFTAANGMVTITDCTMTSPRANATATGTVNLPAQTLSINGTVQIPGLAVIPVGLSGPLSRPVYAIDARSVVNAVTQTLQEHGIDVEQKLRDELDKQVQRGLQHLLRR